MTGGSLFLLSLLALAYLLPTLVAYLRRHHNQLAIFMLNLLLGWSGIGWIGALIWACTAVRPAPAQLEMQLDAAPARSFLVPVAGESHRNADGTERQAIIAELRAGDAAHLRREPDNPYDRNAIVVTDWKNRQIGYVAADVAARLAQDLDGPRRDRYSATIASVNGEPGRRGVVLRVAVDQPA